MSFASPWFALLLLLLIPLVMRLLTRKTKSRVPLSSSLGFQGLSSWRTTLWWLPEGLRILALVALIIALMRPRMPGAERASGDGVAMVLALDMSSSMTAVDLPAVELSAQLERGEIPKNRFENAREVLKQFIVERNRQAADQIGLVIFGREAWSRYPLTHDHARLIRSLNELVIDPGVRTRDGNCANNCTINGGGTAIGDALRRAYSQVSRSEEAKSRIIVLITDGKEQGGSTSAEAIIKHLQTLPPEQQVRVYTFQVGGRGEMYIQRVDAHGRPLQTARGPLYEAPAQPFPTDPELLQRIAESTGGKYYESYSGEKFREDIADLARTAFQSEFEAPQVDVFSWPLLAALVLLLGEWTLRFSLFRSALS